ncbi:MAG TPA: hypothetical protein VMN36_11785 [Verrucomicrobiales bacterium]|nr:hypothetical protein [Verrucomicrobiales bacterium]
MTKISLSVVGALTLLALTACQTIPSTTESGRDGLALVAGSWEFSHFGAPTVWNSEMPDPTSFMEAQFEQARIILDSEGIGSMSMAGQAHTIETELVEESDSFVKLRFKGQPDGDSMIYDKLERSLMMPTKLELPNTEGVLPTYFRRRR